MKVDYSGQTLDDKYSVEGMLGEGGMGTVYLGKHTAIGRPVAIKFLRAEYQENEEAIKRFYREAQAAAAIRHTNIIDVLDIGVSPQGEPYLVLEYLEGESLESRLARLRVFDLETACGILESVLLALRAAHERGIVHRDLKPDNIFLVQQGSPVPIVKLIDFGISKFVSNEQTTQLTQDGSMLGTPAYMSPEQAKGSKDVDYRTDLYAVGVIFFEMLTGETPFSGKNYNELLINVLTKEPKDPKEVFEGFPDRATPVIEKALKKDFKERYQSAEEMLEDLRGLCTMEERFSRMSNLAIGMQTTCFATGSLGNTKKSETGSKLADKVLSQMMAQGARERVDRQKKDWQSWLKNKSAQIAGVLAVLSILGVLLIGFFQQSGVLITVNGAPEDAQIFYDDALVISNPFRAQKGETIVPLRIEAKGFKIFKIAVEPSKDRVIEADMQPKTVAARRELAKMKKGTSGKDGDEDDDENGIEKGRGSSKSEAKENLEGEKEKEKAKVRKMRFKWWRDSPWKRKRAKKNN